MYLQICKFTLDIYKFVELHNDPKFVHLQAFLMQVSINNMRLANQAPYMVYFDFIAVVLLKT